MKLLRPCQISSLIFLLIVIISCSKETDNNFIPVPEFNPDTLVFVPSMKGYELYSWPNGNDWNYSILPGSNRIKSLEEVNSNNIIVFGTDKLKRLLNRIPANESIFWEGENWLEQMWGGDIGNLSLPENAIVNDVIRYCEERQLILSINE
jgi:hypothetical protein